MLKTILPVLFFTSLFVNVAQAQFKVPALTAPVMDQANIIDEQTEAALNNAIRQLRDSGGSQINVLTVPTLNDVPIEQATIQVTDQWKLGSKKEDNGVLLLISTGDHKMRIEVGQGLEGALPDVIAKRIIEDRIAPFMREGKTSEAVVAGVASIIQYTDPKFDISSSLQVPQARADRNSDIDINQTARLIKLGLLMLMFIIFLRPGRRRSGLLGAAVGYGLGRGGGGWGGGGGFGGGGGGSWGGGGGGFSGGGASGGW